MAKSLLTLNNELGRLLKETTSASTAWATEAQIRDALNAGIAALGGQYYREERLLPIWGTSRFPRRLPANCRYDSGLRQVILTSNTGQTMITKLVSTTYTSYLSQTNDGVIATQMDIGGLAAADYIYCGANRRFGSIAVRMLYAGGVLAPMAVNVIASVLSATYWNGSSWTSLGITDGTALEGRTFARDGVIEWSMPSDWIPSTVNSVQAYHIRLAVSATLSTAVVIEEVRFDAQFTPQEISILDWVQRGDTLYIAGVHLAEETNYSLRLIYEAPLQQFPSTVTPAGTSEQVLVNMNANVAVSDTSLTVDTVSLATWPPIGYAEIVTSSVGEIVSYERQSATIMLVERGKFGTVIATHLNNDLIHPVFPGTDAQCELIKTFALHKLFGDQQIRTNIGGDLLNAYAGLSKQQLDTFMRLKEDPNYRQRPLPLIRRSA